MQRSIGYVKNHKQVIIKILDAKEDKFNNKIIDIESLNSQNLQALLYEPEHADDENLREAMLANSKFYPIRDAKELSLNAQLFEDLNKSQSQEVIDKILSSWVLQNNISLLDEMFVVTDHLNKLWPNDRTTFFEELWFLLKNNLGATTLRLVYNDLKKIGRNEDKNSLIQVLITGDKIPNPQEGKEFEKKLMEDYKDEFVENFNVVEYSTSKGQIVIAGNIKTSPFLIMAEVSDFGQLQKSLLNTFITSLSR